MSILDFFFKKTAAKNETKTVHTRFINEPATSYFACIGSPSSSDIAVSAIDAISRNISKLKGSHTIDTKATEDRLTRLLQIRPNAIMSASDFLYKVASNYYLTNNSFIFVDKDEQGAVKGFLPVTYTSAQFLHDDLGQIYVSFQMKSGEKRILPYCDLVHLRRHFTTRRLTGDSNDAILPALELANAQNQGLTNSIQSAANIRGILKFEQLASKDLITQEKDRFKEDFLSIENDGGVIVLDAKTNFQPIEMHPVVLDEGQTKQIREKIFSYYGITENIVTASYSEDEYASFFESVVEPFALQLSLEMSAKIFTEREIAFGNRIIFEAGRLQFSNNKTKVELIKELLPTGLLTINQCLEILNMPSIPDGDRRLQTLNYIDQDKATEYQMARAHSNIYRKEEKTDE